jgi:hypothetical protein
MSFTIEQLYRCTRQEFCDNTGISPTELLKSLEAEISMLKRSLDTYSKEYRNGGFITSDIQRDRSAIIYEIRDKIDRKSAKVRDIKKEFQL